ncbi:MAG TPA: ATP-binding cassette domain-containing protein [Treponemataceae bacterium]|nr:ATP-binding cassette domain-containing protein [Treponemataceae bacterium]
MNKANTIATIENISYTYPGSEKPAISSLSFALEEGGYLAILGENGSGKSTLVRCIAGLLEPENGTTVIQKKEGFVPSALVFQSPGDQLVGETVELDIAFGPENLGLSQVEMNERVNSSLSQFALSSFSNVAVQDLSSGTKQHLALAGVIALNPSLLLLDEPTSMLSPQARVSLLDFLDHFHSLGGSIIHITHNLEEACRADSVLVLNDGVSVFSGTPNLLLSLPSVQMLEWGLAGEAVESGEAIESVLCVKQIDFLKPLVSCSKLNFGPVQDLSFNIMPGTITAVTGESGSGKTALLSVLAGLTSAEAGSCVLSEGTSVALAVQESEASLFAEFVADDVAFGPRNKGLRGKELQTRVRWAMEMAQIPYEEFAERNTFSLSGGERRKTALAGIIAMDSDLVLMDEPTSALDTRSRSALLFSLKKLRNSGKAVVFTTNRMEECDIADSVIHLHSTTTIPETYRIETPLQKLVPLLRYILTLIPITTALLLRGWLSLVFLISIELIPVFISRYSVKKLIKGIVSILPWLIILAVLQYIFFPEMHRAITFVIRFIALYIPLVLFIHICSHTEIMYGMEDLLLPLRIVRFPVQDAALVTGIVFRFVSLLQEESSRIIAARKMRGAGLKKKENIAEKITTLASLFVPLVIRTLTRAERLAQAIQARYYGFGKKSRYMHWKVTALHIVLILVAALTATALVYLSFNSGCALL